MAAASTQVEPGSSSLPRYDAFISYSHAADNRLAPALRRGLHRLAKPWYRPRAMRAFRDEENLSINPDLWASVSQALQASRFFILMASPQAARSPWVAREVDYWRAHRECDTFLIALTDGTIYWDDAAGDFDWARTTALPHNMRGWFATEPLWAHLTWARDETQLSIRHPRFRREVAKLAAPIRSMALPELEDEDSRQHRTARRLLQWGITVLTTVTALAVMLLVVTVRQRHEVEEQRDQAVSRALAAQSEELGDSDPDLARLLSVAAWEISPTPEAHAGMLLAAAHPGVAAIRTGDEIVAVVAFSPDGRMVATGGDDNVVRLWDVSTRRQVGDPFVGHTGTVRSVLFTRDSKTLVTAADDGTVRLWDIATHRQVGGPLVDRGGSETPGGLFDPSVALSPDGTTVATGLDAGEVRLWDLKTRRSVGAPLVGHTSISSRPTRPSVAFGRDGAVLATVANDGTVRLWNTRTQRQIAAPLVGHPVDPSAPISPSIVFSPDGTTVASAGLEAVIRFWDVSAHRQAGTPLTGYDRPDRFEVRPTIVFAPNGQIFVTGAHDGTIRLWDASRRQIGQPLAGHSAAVHSVAFSPDGRMLASGAQDGTLRLWDVTRFQQFSTPMIGHVAPVYSVAFSPNGKMLASGGDYGGVTRDHNSLTTCGQGGWGICLSGAGWVIIAAPGDSTGGAVQVTPPPGMPLRPPVVGPTVMLWDAVTGRPLGKLSTKETRTVRALAFSPDGENLATADVDVIPDKEKGLTHLGRMSLWQISSRRQVASSTTGDRLVRSLAFSPDGQTLAVAGEDDSPDSPDDPNRPTVYLREADTTGRDVDYLNQVTMYSVAFSPDGRRMAASGQNGTVRLWDVADPQHPQTLERHRGSVGSVAFSPDGQMLASAGDDGTVRLWDIAAGRQRGEPLVGHTGPVYSVTFSPDGQTLASGGGDNSIRLWDTASHRQISGSNMGHTAPVRAVRFSPDGRTLATAGEDSAVRLWDVSFTVNVVSTLCTTVHRSLTPEEWMRYLPSLPYRPICA